MKNLYACVFCFLVTVLPLNAHAQVKKTYMIEAENFQFRGGWVVENVAGAQVSGNKIARVYAGQSAAPDASTVIDIKAGGRYAVWVNSPDYPTDRPGSRTFKVSVNEIELAATGKHGREGYYWEKAGVVQLANGQQLLRLNDLKPFARCDAIILSSTDGFDPNTIPLIELQKNRINPFLINTFAQTKPNITPKVVTAASLTVAQIEGENIQLRFVLDALSTKKRIVAKTSIRKNGEWINMNPEAEDHKIYVINSDDPQFSYGTFFPSWSNTRGSDSIRIQGKIFKVVDADNLLNPFNSGTVSEAVAIDAKKLDSNSIAVKYQTANGAVLTGVWSISSKTNHLSIRLNYKVPKAGYYSLAVAAFQPLPAAKVTNVQMPPMFQYRRLSPQPKMLVSAMMPQPLAIVETNLSGGQFSTFVTGDVRALPADDWGTGTNAPYGFTLKNETNNVQPVVFSPVLGLNNSKFKAGETIERSFITGAVASGWNTALEYISNNIYQVKDYRQQKTALTDAVFNMIDLIKNTESSGWNANLKGFYDIEGDPKTAPTVVQCSPLTMLSAAVIGKDEDFYITRALPTIEYTLSRSGFRWATDLVPTSFNNTRKTLMLNPLTSQFTTAYYEGLYQLLGQANPWIAEIAMPGNNIRQTNGYAVEVPAWTQLLAAYRLTKDTKWLNLAKAGADVYITKQVYANSVNPMTKVPFYNASFYANWWEFLDLYEITNEEKYLNAGEASAFHTIAGIRSFPLVKDTLQTIHPNNKFEGVTTMWWKGKSLYRLGYPRVAGDAPEKQVPQAQVSPVGLGFEQPETYFDPVKTVKPVYMSSWAPNLLRLYQYTHRELFNIYSRNAIIGRFGNYPGYYAPGFTDITLNSDFPYKGPDVSSIYYHHIPPHLSFTMDYLITEAVARSNGKVSFPYSKQDAFVWFDNRIYGTGKGLIYDDKYVQLWLKKDLIALNTAQVNYITAVSKSRFWVLLSGESNKALPVTIRISKQAGIVPGRNALVYAGDDLKGINLKVNNGMAQVQIPVKGFTAISFPIMENTTSPALPPVKDGMKVLDGGETWGKIFLFRIRSPFGWDSIYGFAETAPIKGATMGVVYKDQTVTKTNYPFEWSFIKIDSKEPVALKLKFTSDDGHVKEEKVTMDGAR